jgi:hypothetical protein
MEAWLSYSLDDLLLFSPEVYFGLFEKANLAFWPWQMTMVPLALALWLLMRHPGRRSRVAVDLLLALSWGVSAYGFLGRFYVSIYPAAEWFEFAFVAEAALLIAAALHRTRSDDRSQPVAVIPCWHPGTVLFLLALCVHPLIGPALGRPWQGVELFGLAPDATALGTIGILLTRRLSGNWWLLPVPLLWLCVSALTYIAMERPAGALPLAVAAVALVATFVIGRRGSKWRGA